MRTHPSGKFQKRINRKLYYFRAWAIRKGGRLVPVEVSGWENSLAEHEAKLAELQREAETVSRRETIAAELKATHDAPEPELDEQQLAELQAQLGVPSVA